MRHADVRPVIAGALILLAAPVICAVAVPAFPCPEPYWRVYPSGSPCPLCGGSGRTSWRGRREGERAIEEQKRFLTEFLGRIDRLGAEGGRSPSR